MPQSSRVILDVASATDPGLDPEKQVNEDAYAFKDLGLGHLLVVCDGMGGHMGGKEASNLAIRTVVADLEASSPEANPAMALRAAIEHAGREVYELGGPPTNLLRPGSTVVAILSHPSGSEVAHVGDSRGYMIRDGQIHAITRDHSMVQQMVDAGMLKPEEAEGHPDANKILRALGMAVSVDVEVRPHPLAHQKGDVFLLASDGLTDLVKPAEMLGITMQARQGSGLESACQQMVSLANSRGGHDNITVVLGEVVECPFCEASVEMPSKTLIPDEPVQHLPDGGPMVAMVGRPITPGLHPTVVDHKTPPTWIGDGPVQSPSSDFDLEEVRRRKLTWWVVGGGLVIFGVLLMIASLWWAYSGLSVAMVRDSDECGLFARAEVSFPSPCIGEQV